MKISAVFASISLAVLLAGCAATTKPTTQSQSVAFIEPVDGAVVSGLFKLKFAVSGMEVRPAGDVIPNTGHFHLLINKGSVPPGTAIPFLDYEQIHYTQGQTETQFFLPPGAYKLTLQFADGVHHSYGPGMSRTIGITVK